MQTGPLAAPTQPSRVDRSFTFIDLCGFTDFADSEGDVAAVEQVRCLRQVVREVTPLFGVRVEKWLGDGVMIVGVDSEPLVAAVVAIEQRAHFTCTLPLRAGIASGKVLLVDGDDYIGKAVNVAARLCDFASSGQVLAAAEGLHLPEWVEAVQRSHVQLRGLGEAVEVVELRVGENSPPLHDVPDRPGWWLAALLDGLTRPVRARRGS